MGLIIITSLLVISALIVLFYIFSMNKIQEAVEYLDDTSKILQETDKIWYKITSGCLKTEEELRSALNEITKLQAKLELRMKYYKEHFE